MPNTLEWNEIALRLFWTVLAGTLIGINRSEHGRPAGLRTTLLVCLAASVSMIQVNLLLPLAGKAKDSYVVLDLMRLPLGILSGMGFIGGGAILRKESRVLGVTTAATLWFTTVIGLCFGGGQTALGLWSLAIGLIVLWGLKSLEALLPQDEQAKLVLATAADGPTQEAIRDLLPASLRVVSVSMVYDNVARSTEMTWEVSRRVLPEYDKAPAFLRDLAQEAGISRIEWRPTSAPRGAG